MRKITTQAVNAFINNQIYGSANTYVFIKNGETIIELHNNVIAKKSIDGIISISNAGWCSNVTKERLNGIPGVSIKQKAGQWYLNGQAWDGSWITL